MIARNCTHKTFATCWEILIATFCSVLCFSYIIHVEGRDNPVFSPSCLPYFISDQLQGFSPHLYFPPAGEGFFSWILNPSPALMLVGCIILGCAVSSFAYRRHESDRHQIPIFGLTISAALLVGSLIGYHMHFVLLGMLPWAACFAMIASVCVHAFGRRCCHHSSTEIDLLVRCEKGLPVLES